MEVSSAGHQFGFFTYTGGALYNLGRTNSKTTVTEQVVDEGDGPDATNMKPLVRRWSDIGQRPFLEIGEVLVVIRLEHTDVTAEGVDEFSH